LSIYKYININTYTYLVGVAHILEETRGIRASIHLQKRKRRRGELSNGKRVVKGVIRCVMISH
jgi:hypothetical protein